MGASRKLQGEIDRVLKKVLEGVDLFDIIWNKVYDTDNANQKEKYEADLKKEIKKLQRYRDQIKTWIQSNEIKDKKALMEARKQIEREMERFKICEKETKTKAFSKEGLGQQPKTDPKEKAKSETRDWINNVVGELESQIDNFEAEIEGLTVKKGKNRPPRLTHLENSITRHKAHIMKLELILRLLDNEELSTEQVNDVKDFLEDYLERNQDDFDEFCDVDELYSTLPMDKVEALEDLVTIGQPSLVKLSVAASSSIASLKTSMESSPSQTPAVGSSPQLSVSQFEHEEVASKDTSSETSDAIPKTPYISNLISHSSLTSPVGSHTNPIPVNASLQLPGTPIASTTAYERILESEGASMSSSSLNITTVPINDNALNIPGRKLSTSLAETGVVTVTVVPGMTGQSVNLPLDSGAIVSGSAMTLEAVPLTSDVRKNNLLVAEEKVLSSGIVSGSAMTLEAVPLTSDVRKNNVLVAEEKVLSSGMLQPYLTNSLSNKMLQPQSTSSTDGTATASSSYVGDPAVSTGRTFTSSVTPAMQWRPGSPFHNPNEMGQFRGRTEIAPDQREKFLQRFQQVQQQGPSNILGFQTHGISNHKQHSALQQDPILQQVNSLNSALVSQVGPGIHAKGLSTAMPASSAQPYPSIDPHATQQGSLLNDPQDADVAHEYVEEQKQQQSPSDDSTAQVAPGPGAITQRLSNVGPQTSSTNDVPILQVGAVSGSLRESALQRDFGPAKSLLSSQPSSLGVIGRRSVLDLGAIDDNIGATCPSIGEIHDQIYNYKMLESAFYKLPQPKDSERAKSYTPRHPAVTPSSYPQAQAPVINNPALWERMAHMPETSDTLLFTFYFQQKTYQQFLAAKALKKQAWRFHRQYNTWFQRHEEPDEATDDYEKGSYVYFDVHVGEDDKGWCQRLKHDFVFEYSFLEDDFV